MRWYLLLLCVLIVTIGSVNTSMNNSNDSDSQKLKNIQTTSTGMIVLGSLGIVSLLFEFIKSKTDKH